MSRKTLKQRIGRIETVLNPTVADRLEEVTSRLETVVAQLTAKIEEIDRTMMLEETDV